MPQFFQLCSDFPSLNYGSRENPHEVEIFEGSKLRLSPMFVSLFGTPIFFFGKKEAKKRAGNLSNIIMERSAFPPPKALTTQNYSIILPRPAGFHFVQDA